MIRELSFTRREEKVFRWIISRDKQMNRPLKGWTVTLIIAATLIAYGGVLYLAMQETVVVPKFITTLLDKGLWVVLLIAASVQLSTRDKIIRKLYQALAEEATTTQRDTETSQGT